jgi:hypothetical protein
LASFWQEEGSLEASQYLNKLGRISPVLIGCFSISHLSIFEAYWAKEDRIAPFYDAGVMTVAFTHAGGEENTVATQSGELVIGWCITCFSMIRTQRVVASLRRQREDDRTCRPGFTARRVDSRTSVRH